MTPTSQMSVEMLRGLAVSVRVGVTAISVEAGDSARMALLRAEGVSF
jgi:hypothetical protein